MPEYLDLPGLGEYIHRSPGAIRNLVLRRAIPFKKPAGRLLFIKQEIDQWINESAGISVKQIAEGAAKDGNGGLPGDPRPSAFKPTRRANAETKVDKKIRNG